jgi:hypothetical protein
MEVPRPCPPPSSQVECALKRYHLVYFQAICCSHRKVQRRAKLGQFDPLLSAAEKAVAETMMGELQLTWRAGCSSEELSRRISGDEACWCSG